VNSSPSSTDLDPKRLFSFELDEFQHQAIAALNADKSVVVCAPTGSGKTLIGEYAIYRALSQGRRVFYTTPLKALSNQKLRDFSQVFGTENVGLVTGDLSLNREASVVIMTTEVFRNMLYGTPIGQIGTSIQGVEAVVLDECHYMNDRQRGTVWEESIIYCPPHIQLVALSATVANSDQLTAWLSDVHGPTELIYSDFRPVPLQYNFCNLKGIFPLLNKKGNSINRLLLNPKARGKKPPKVKPKDQVPGLLSVVSQLSDRDMLPAIYFIFSRKGCDRAVAETVGLSLLSSEEKRQVAAHIELVLHEHPEAIRRSQVECLYRGVASHHAGLLPAWKSLVEELFQQGLIKVVFATETLAAGINMPARTTIISSLSKRTDQGHRLLNPSEFLQMAGRAGRRGMDEIGHLVVVETRFEGAKEAGYLATAGADPLVSQFTPSYGMVLNLLQTHSLEEAKQLIERSFGQYMANLTLIPQQQAIAALQAEEKQIHSQLASYGNLETLQELAASYKKLQERLREAKRLLKTLQNQAERARTKDLAAAIDFAVQGTVLSLKGKHITVPQAISAILVRKVPGSGQAPYLVCLGADNRWMVATYGDVVGLYGDIPRFKVVDGWELPPELGLKPGECRSSGTETTATANQIPQLEPTLAAPEVDDQLLQVEEITNKLMEHPVHQWPERGRILKQISRAARLETEIGDRLSKFQRLKSRYWEEFLNLIAILQAFNALNPNLVPTPLGESAATLRGENELWLGIALTSEAFAHLEPHHLAAACAALVTETPRPDSWVNYNTSQPVIESLLELQGMRRQLFQQQRRYDVALPIWLEYELIALVEQWAQEQDWAELCEQTSLDEGDIVRLLRRTLDLLSQIPHIPHVSDTLKDNAIWAMKLLNRFPVNETVNN